MWAITDFTAENGATRLLPGSHRAETGPAYASEVEGLVPAAMKAGSVLVFDGSLWHQAADNVTEDECRLGLQVSYCAGWIRPFTNHFLSIPRETAARFPRRLVELLGYGTFNGAIGTISEPGTHRYANSAFRDPASVLESASSSESR
jgi:ectoine hydroxylase-related dioxygenase (phytanoyl-CoA dioxygenase family)